MVIFVQDISLMKKLIIFFLALSVSMSFAQSTSLGKESTVKDTVESPLLIQLTGIIITDSLYRVPFTRVADVSTRRGSIADYYGYFALVVHPGDTILFSSLGYKRNTYVVPDTATQSISIVHVMQQDTIEIDPVDVYPWPSREEFADAFLNMDIPDDELRIAQQRLSPQELAFVGASLEVDGTGAYSAYRVAQSQATYTRGQTPANNLLNPAAWAEFLQGIGTGKYKIEP